MSRRKGRIPTEAEIADAIYWTVPSRMSGDGLDGMVQINKLTGDAKGYVVAPFFSSERVHFTAPGGRNINGRAQQALEKYLQKRGSEYPNIKQALK